LTTLNLFGHLSTATASIGLEQELATADCNVVWGCDADSNFVALDGNDGNDDIVAQEDTFPFSPSQYEH